MFCAVLRHAWASPDTRAALERVRCVDTIARRALDDASSRRAEDIATHGLRTCALGACGAKERSVRDFPLCARCRGVYYCCAEHQRLHWAEHKTACTAGKPRAAEGAAPTNHED